MPTIEYIQNYDYGNIKIVLKNPEPSNTYRVFRWQVSTNKKETFQHIGTLDSDNQYTFIDTTIEQGEMYQYDCWSPSNVSLGRSDYIIIDFEDIMLSDGERSLRVRFNPKVSSFKKTIQEQKIDTLGSRFPFFFRNGNINYRELSISGLISLEMDEWFYPILGQEELFLPRDLTPSFSPPVSRNKSRELYYSERKFKLEVEAWLTNGKPKIFRSPTEGNYIIRLMNVSLSPEDQLSRRLHSFSATAYEIADFTIDNLKKLELLNPNLSEKTIGLEAGENQYGKVRSSFSDNSVFIEKDLSLTINNITIDKLAGDDENNLYLLGYKEDAPAMLKMIRSGIVIPEVPASNTQAGFVIGSSARNQVSIESGNMEINEIGLEKIQEIKDNESYDFCVGDITNEMKTVRTTDENSDNPLFSVIGTPNTINKFSVEAGVITLNSISMDKIIYDEITIGGNQE